VDLFEGINSRYARKLPVSLHRKAWVLLTKIDYISTVEELRFPPSNRLEMLKGNLVGYYSIRINQQFRIIFKWHNGHAEAVQVIDYH